MFSEKSLTKANLIAFLKEKGLYEECGEWCQPRFEKAEQEKAAALAAEPIPSRYFNWEGHYTRCCYEMSSERFDHSATWEYLINDLDLMPFNWSDPTDKDCERAEGWVQFKDTKKFSAVCGRMLGFVDGVLDDDVDRCHDFDKFGFDNPPSKDALKEWLGNLWIDPDEIEELDPKDCFVGPCF